MTESNQVVECSQHGLDFEQAAGHSASSWTSGVGGVGREVDRRKDHTGALEEWTSTIFDLHLLVEYDLGQ